MGDTVAFDSVASDGLISSAISYIDAAPEDNGGIVNINARSPRQSYSRCSLL